MSTVSLQKDHDLITKVVKSMEATTSLLEEGKEVPGTILMQVIDFSTNFTDICHHSKEEDSLFPALVGAGMEAEEGPVAMMLQDHEKTREIGARMEASARVYLAGGGSKDLVADLKEYVQHMTEHLWKESNRLFPMAEARLQHMARKVDAEVHEIEDAKLRGVKKDRAHYEKLADDLAGHLGSG
ncbi:conserved hypothetical protein [Cenarchaeum symbiosum A]|uniref:Hemerythrin-like domain-containing protein n=1 Tax=Cenarchaeum symbiosum (strain A) TaxID=414004 RepID=A0RYF5_CENSY|nr:conserved hypothetical protein [Cenarchaeum symbiosum A]